jgi:hypothetical protein
MALEARVLRYDLHRNAQSSGTLEEGLIREIVFDFPQPFWVCRLCDAHARADRV